MNEIRALFKTNHIFHNSDINKILKIIFKMFDIDGNPCLIIDNKISWCMAFFREEPYNFYINWQIVADSLKNKNVKEANYWIFFYCLHEVMHHRQLVSGVTDDLIVQDIFKKSYDYIEELYKKKLANVFHKIVYRIFHDFFPLEINADILAYIKLLEILKEIDLEYYNVFIIYFKRRVEGIYEKDVLNDIYAVLLDIDIKLDNYSVEEKLIYGMPISIEVVRSMDIVQLIK